MSEDWLKQLYECNYTMLYRLACNRLTAGMGHLSDAQDVLQEVFLLAARKKICNHPKPEGWLIITTVNVCNNYIQAHARSARKHGRLLKEHENSNVNSRKQPLIANTDAMQDADLRMTIEQTLSDEERKLLTQHYNDGFSLQELSQQMNISPGALRVRLLRIRKKLKNIFVGP